MKIDIRKSIKDNFKNSKKDEIKISIEESIKDKQEVTLPGLGVFLELIFENIDEDQKDFILNVLENSLKE